MAPTAPTGMCRCCLIWEAASTLTPSSVTNHGGSVRFTVSKKWMEPEVTWIISTPCSSSHLQNWMVSSSWKPSVQALPGADAEFDGEVGAAVFADAVHHHQADPRPVFRCRQIYPVRSLSTGEKNWERSHPSPAWTNTDSNPQCFARAAAFP